MLYTCSNGKKDRDHGSDMDRVRKRGSGSGKGSHKIINRGLGSGLPIQEKRMV